MEELISITIVSSPSPSHPSSYLIERCIESFSNLPELALCEVVVVLDGFKLHDTVTRSKKGIIGIDMASSYDEYEKNLIAYLAGRGISYQVHRSDHHRGFAKMVQWSLENFIKTKYCLICQHDRIFTRHFSLFYQLIDKFETFDHIRYIGFPTPKSSTHNSTLKSRYKLSALNQASMRIEISPFHYLQPLIFWYDSQHLCHVSRYLSIFYPLKSLTPSLVEKLGMKRIRNMVIKNGDFIEDKFGQAERKYLVELGDKQSSTDDIRELFLWFGSYLLWNPCKPYDMESLPVSKESQENLVIIPNISCDSILNSKNPRNENMDEGAAEKQWKVEQLPQEEGQEERNDKYRSLNDSDNEEEEDNLDDNFIADEECQIECSLVGDATHFGSVYVVHLKGRQYDPAKVERYKRGKLTNI